MFDLSLVEESRCRPFEVVAPAFVAERLDGPVPVDGLARSSHSPAAPFAAVEVGAAGGDVLAGLATADGDHVLLGYDAARHRVRIEVRREDETHEVAAADLALPDPGRLAFVLCENQVTVLASTAPDDPWEALLTDRDGVAALVDLREPATLASYAYAWGGSGELRDVRAGLFGMTGLRDPHLVQHADGTPYVRDGSVYLTATCAGAGFFRQAHWGMFRLDLAEPRVPTQVGQLFFRRDGLLLGDHAGQVVRDDEHDRWIVATSSWGDFGSSGVHVRHTTTTADVLQGVHVLETDRTPLPTVLSAWDPGLTRVGDRWFVSFVESPSQDPFDFHPALAVSAPGAGWAEDLELVGAATDLHQCEGPVLVELDGRHWLLASDGDHRHYPVFDLTMRRVGRLDAPYPSNIPHPQLVPLPDGGHLMVSFDGTGFGGDVLGYGGHGDVVLMRSR
jgi:hypothetical protein